MVVYPRGMELYLVQHGKAKSKDEDPERPLNEDGVKDSEASALWAAGHGIEVNEIRHSGKARARETAEIFGKHLNPPMGVQAEDGLAPNDDVAPLAEILREEPEPLMLVGHLPFLARLAGQLVAGDPEKEITEFVNSGVVCLRRQSGGWKLVPDRTNI